jgi:hypothetical protein
MRESQPSPPWGRGWTATRAFTSGGGTGEGVKPVKTPYLWWCVWTAEPDNERCTMGRVS